jgi:hypothetical protein
MKIMQILNVLISIFVITACTYTFGKYLIKLIYLVHPFKFLEKFPKLIATPTDKVSLIGLYLCGLLALLFAILKRLHIL